MLKGTATLTNVSFSILGPKGKNGNTYISYEKCFPLRDGDLREESIMPGFSYVVQPVRDLLCEP